MNTPKEHRIPLEDLEPALACPSAQPDWAGARVFGVVGGNSAEPRLAYLTETLPVTPDLLAQTAPLPATEVLRIAAPCVKHDCQHFAGHHCQLAARTVEHLEPAAEKLPVCAIRSQCRWFHEQGKAACFRCPQVITDRTTAEAAIIRAATPTPG